MYEFDSFPIHWNNFDKLIDKGNIISTPIVKEEILFKYDDLKNWCNKNDKMFKPLNNSTAQELSNLDEKFPIWYHSKDESGKNWADPHLIAYAKAYDSILVTQES
jgi:hypothetical protein